MKHLNWFALMPGLLVSMSMLVTTSLWPKGISALSAVIIMLAGWTLSVFLMSRTRSVDTACSAQIGEVEHATIELLAHLDGLLVNVASQMRNDLGRIQVLIDDAVTTLDTCFQGMVEKSQEQGSLVCHIVRLHEKKEGEAGERSLNRDDFVEETDRVLHYFVDYVVSNNSSAMEMGERIKIMDKEMNQANNLLREVSSLADQANLLAVNAKIEAARAGNAGRAFSIVADEMRTLSQRSNKLNEEIENVIGTSKRSMKVTKETIDKLSSRDSNFAIEAKSRVNDMLKWISEVHKATDATLDMVTENSSAIELLVGDAVRCLQFGDITHQLTEHTTKHLDRIQGLASDMHSEISDLRQAECKDVAHVAATILQIKERLTNIMEQSEINEQPVGQKSMDQGEIELF